MPSGRHGAGSQVPNWSKPHGAGLSSVNPSPVKPCTKKKSLQRIRHVVRLGVEPSTIGYGRKAPESGERERRREGPAEIAPK
jgi:hypothetical protein